MRRGCVRGGLGRPFCGSLRAWPPVPRLWAGETAFIFGSGPSLSAEQVDAVKGQARVIAVNNSYQLAPWADLLYACDYRWWAHYRPEFAGLKVSQDARAEEFGALRVPSVDEPGLSLDPLRIHQGGNGGYQAINLAVLLGAKRIALLGFDMQGGHWHGRHPKGLNNPEQGNFARWIQAFDGMAPDLGKAGVEVINCTPGSALRCFPMVTLEDFLLDTPRHVEHAKYSKAYRATNYRMGEGRKADATGDLTDLGCTGSYLDIGCGRGEMLDHATWLGYTDVRGIEVVPELIDGEQVIAGESYHLPFADKSFDVVSLFDVIEHLIPGDDELTCREMARVARKHILLTANNRPSKNAIGEELHINRRPYEEWDALFRAWFPGQVTWLRGGSTVSERWRVDL